LLCFYPSQPDSLACSALANLGEHHIKRIELPAAAADVPETPPGAAGPAAQLLFQEQAVLRSVCVADQYIHASQHISASMRIHIKPRIAAQGGGMLLVMMDGAPAPARDILEERQLVAARKALVDAAAAAAAEAKTAAAEAEAAEHAAVAAETAAAVAGGDEADANAAAEVAAAAHLRAAATAAEAQRTAALAAPPPPPPVLDPMIIQLGGAFFYPWRKRWHVPEGSPPGTAAPPSIPSAERPHEACETYRIRLPALKLSRLDDDNASTGPTAAIVRSLRIECAATGLAARLRFVPHRPVRDALRTAVIGHMGPSDGDFGVLGAPTRILVPRGPLPPAMPPAPAPVAVPAPPQLPRRRSSGLAGLGRRIRRTISGRVLEEPAPEAPPADVAAVPAEPLALTVLAPPPSPPVQRPVQESLEAAPLVSLYGLWDGKVFADAAPLGITVVPLPGMNVPEPQVAPPAPMPVAVAAEEAPAPAPAPVPVEETSVEEQVPAPAAVDEDVVMVTAEDAEAETQPDAALPAPAAPAPPPPPPPPRLPRRPSLPPAAPRCAATLLYDDGAHVPTRALTWHTGASPARTALRTPMMMLQGLLWCAIVDSLRDAVRNRRTGGDPSVRERLRVMLQAPPAAGHAAVIAMAEGQREVREFGASWLIATPSNTHLPAALGHPRMRRRELPAPPPAAAASAAAEADVADDEASDSESSDDDGPRPQRRASAAA
jgi:hypothetical protein